MVLLEQHRELGSLDITIGHPLFILLFLLLFSPCIINALSKFISQQVQKIKFQFLVYSTLLMQETSALTNN
jgi:hypothetical protein